ncbi:unnamed protein product [Aureobasidium vineae]|uniref:Uncharacterized protein n=1 Tax=Aureobasidium vineae TaxID=2773715 RepID=A0A9N8J6X1_9PEZI|nr:unnamed protein product [Aureobasidium vineae]
MPPIPIYADAPISAAAKADGPTPQTAPLQPGQPTCQRLRLLQPTIATQLPNPAPQLVPHPPAACRDRLHHLPAPSLRVSSMMAHHPPARSCTHAPSPSTRSNAYDPTSPAAPRAQPMPHQLNIPPPTTSGLPTHTTAAASPTSPTRRPVTLPMGPVSPTMHSRPQSISTHPPGYQQNPYAAEMTSAQRASLEAAEAAERGRKSGRNSISEWITGEDDGFGRPTTGTAKAWFKGVASQVGDMATKANEFASKKLG